MATTPLVITGGVFKIGATDYSDAISKVIIRGNADTVEVPQTLSTPASDRKGKTKYEMELEFLANDIDLTNELFSVFFDALDSTGTGQLAYEVHLRTGAVSASNPKWTGTLIVTEAAVGGQVGDVSLTSATFPLTAKPVRGTS